MSSETSGRETEPAGPSLSGNASAPSAPRAGSLTHSSKIRSAVTTTSRGLIRSFITTGTFLRKRLWIWPILAGIVLGMVGWQLRSAIEGALKQEMAANLQTILNADVTALQIWIRSQEAIAQATARDPQLRMLAESLIAGLSEGEADQLSLLQAPELQALRDELQPVLEAHGCVGFLILDRRGRVVAADRNAPVGLAADDAEMLALIERVLSGQPTVTPPTKSRVLLPDADGVLRTGLPTMFAAAAIGGDGTAAVGMLALRIRPQDEFTEILRVARAGASGETYAFNRDGMMLSQSRFDDELRTIGLLTEDADSILNVSVRDPQADLTEGQRSARLRSEQPLTRMAAAAVETQAGIDIDGYRDYRGVPVVGAWTWLDDYGMGIATEIDVAEAYRPLYILRTAFWGMFALLAASAVAIFVFTLMVDRLNRQARQAALQAKRLGQYTLDEKLGEGGMGVVYRGRHAMLQRPTAVKFLHVDRTSDETVARFEQEVKLTSQLTHPNTIAIYDYGRTSEGIFYYAMEYLEGMTLEDFVRRYGPQSEGRVIFLLRQVCGSLAEAHRAGLIHRDVKPANIMLTQRGGMRDFVKVLDFGLAKALDASRQAGLTSAGALTGTPLYMPPESIHQSATIDLRSDLYAIGAVGYFLLTGTPVFDGDTVMEIVQHHLTTAPVPPSQRLNKPVSDDLQQVLLRCLAKEPRDRPASATELSDALAVCTAAGDWSEREARQWWRRRDAGTGATPLSLEATLIGPAPADD